MNTTNYCAEYLTLVNNPRLRIEGVDKTMVDATADWISRAVKFRLPDNGLVLEVLPISKLNKTAIKDTYSKYLEVVRLPYDAIALEFMQKEVVNGKPVTAKVVILANNTPDEGIVFTVIYGDRMGAKNEWVNVDFFGFLESDFNVSARTVGYQIDEISQEQNTVLLHALNVLLGFMCALQCSNSRAIDIPASNLLNKKRIKKGKQPFFNYKILTIDTKRDGKQQKGGHGTGNTKRVHLRRGHIRRLEDKTVWVNPCVVGDKSKGMATKDYRVI